MKNVNTTFNNQNYQFNILLWNIDGQVFQFTPSNIEKLIIEDSIVDIFTKGQITFKNSYDIIFRTLFDGDKKIVTGYNFRGDGKDYLHIEIFPTTGNSEKDSSAFPDDVWKMSQDFVIYEVIDQPANSQSEKRKTFLFWDKTYHELYETVESWSTVDLIENSEKEIWNLPDEDKRVEVGKILKHILSFSKNSKFSDKWENGNTKLFYTSQMSNVLLEDFWYIWGKYMTENDDVGILKKNRNDGKWSLQGLSKYFQKACKDGNTNIPGQYQIEHIYLESLEETKNGIPASKAPTSNTNPTIIDIKTQNNILGSYEYTEMSPKDSLNAMIDFPIHSYNFKTGEFGVIRYETKIKNVIEHLRENYGKYLKTYKNNNYSNILIPPDRKIAKGINNLYSFGIDRNDKLADGRNQMIYNSLFLNNMLKLTLPGSIHRQSGRFIGLDRENDTKNITDHDIDNKLLGQWFLTKVYHVWDNGNYTNIIIGNKFHDFFNKTSK